MNTVLGKLVLGSIVATGIAYIVSQQAGTASLELLISSHIAVALLVIMLCQFLPGSTSTGSAPKNRSKPAAGRHSGEVKWFNGGKGFGFITYGSEQEIFVHFRSLRKGSKRLTPGKQVEFTIGEGKKGVEAEDVVVLD